MVRAWRWVGAMLATVLAGALASAEVVCGPVGSGAPYSSIQAAIDAAAVGERVLVLPGVYEESLVLTRGVDLVGVRAAEVIVCAVPSPGSDPAAPIVTVRDVPPGELVRVSSLTLDAPPNAKPRCIVAVEDCVGAVELYDLAAWDAHMAPVTIGGSAGLLEIRASGLVVVTECSFVASLLAALTADATPFDGANGAWIEDSRVWIVGCRFGGAWGSVPIGAASSGGAGGAGIACARSDVQIGATVSMGGSSGGTAEALAGQGGSGLVALDSRIGIAGNEGNGIFGASATHGVGLGSITRYASAGPGAVLLGASALELAVDVVLHGGHGDGAFAAAAHVHADPAAHVESLPERLPTLRYYKVTAELGTISRRIYEGEPGSIHWVFASVLGTYPALDVVGIGAVLAWGPPVTLTPAIVLGESGRLDMKLPVPQNPTFSWLAFVAQDLQWAPQTGLRLSPPTVLRLVP